MHFITQLAPDTGIKLQKLEAVPQTPQQELINLAFKVFNNRDEAIHKQGISEFQLFTSTMTNPQLIDHTKATADR